MYYFASDIHLGAGIAEESRQREHRFVEWLERVSLDAEAIFLCGDIFDFWFEYDKVVPKGFTRTLGALSRITDRGVRVVFMTGNHDMWVGEYLREECGLELYTTPQIFELSGKRVYVAHGDNLKVCSDWRLRFINKLFRSNAIRSLTRIFIHPNLLLRFGAWWSGSSRQRHKSRDEDNTIDGKGIQTLIDYARERESLAHCDYYIFGHLHQHVRYEGGNFKVIFISDWSGNPHYATIDGEGKIDLKQI